MVVIQIITRIYAYKSERANGSHIRFKYAFNRMVCSLISLLIEIQGDIFLLWLLYKFMKPQRIITADKTEASALLFAHDAKSAQESLLDQYKEEHEQRRAEILQ